MQLVRCQGSFRLFKTIHFKMIFFHFEGDIHTPASSISEGIWL